MNLFILGFWASVLALTTLSIANVVDGQLSATPDGIRMKQLGIIVLDNANMLEKHTNILEICNLEFKNLDFTHFDSCYSFSESYNTMLRNFDNATEEYAIDIMGFGK